MKLLVTTTAILGLTALSAGAATLSGSTGYALAKNGRDLTTIGDLGDTSMSSSVRLGKRIDALAYRPVTGELYGYRVGRGSGADSVFVIDAASGALTDTGAVPGDGVGLTQGSKVGFDFNNAIDAARAVSTSDENVVFFPSSFPDERANTILQFTDLAYNSGDANEGRDPKVFGNAYTNAVDGATASTTLQFALDARTNSLVTLDNNNGTLDTVGQITVDGEVLKFNTNGGLEILSDSEGDNLAVALLRSGGSSGLYTLDLATGAASAFGSPGDGKFRSFAAMTGDAAPGPAPVPLPAGLPLLLAGLGAFGGLRLLRRKTA